MANMSLCLMPLPALAPVAFAAKKPPLSGNTRIARAVRK
jgi:hypothetical protein